MATHTLTFSCVNNVCTVSNPEQPVSDGDTVVFSNGTAGTVQIWDLPAIFTDTTNISIAVNGPNVSREVMPSAGNGDYDYEFSSTACPNDNEQGKFIVG